MEAEVKSLGQVGYEAFVKSFMESHVSQNIAYLYTESAWRGIKDFKIKDAWEAAARAIIDEEIRRVLGGYNESAKDALIRFGIRSIP